MPAKAPISDSLKAPPPAASRPCSERLSFAAGSPHLKKSSCAARYSTTPPIVTIREPSLTFSSNKASSPNTSSNDCAATSKPRNQPSKSRATRSRASSAPALWPPSFSHDSSASIDSSQSRSSPRSSPTTTSSSSASIRKAESIEAVQLVTQRRHR